MHFICDYISCIKVEHLTKSEHKNKVFSISTVK